MTDFQEWLRVDAWKQRCIYSSTSNHTWHMTYGSLGISGVFAWSTWSRVHTQHCNFVTVILLNGLVPMNTNSISIIMWWDEKVTTIKRKSLKLEKALITFTVGRLNSSMNSKCLCWLIFPFTDMTDLVFWLENWDVGYGVGIRDGLWEVTRHILRWRGILVISVT